MTIRQRFSVVALMLLVLAVFESQPLDLCFKGADRGIRFSHSQFRFVKVALDKSAQPLDLGLDHQQFSPCPRQVGLKPTTPRSHLREVRHKSGIVVSHPISLLGID